MDRCIYCGDAINFVGIDQSGKKVYRCTSCGKIMTEGQKPKRKWKARDFQLDGAGERTCPMCGSKIHFAEGCMICPACGWSMCG